ncbi:MAG: dipeptidase PepV [Methanothrix sp.]|nr:dipeptidase PepV [Methanothrix sp.]
MTDDSVAEKLNKLVEKEKDELINSTQVLVMIKSVNGQPKPDAPFGEGPAQALDKALEIAGNLGFNTTNLDGYIGYAEYGQGTDYVGVLAHVDVVPEGEGWKYPPYGAEIHDGRMYGRGTIDDKGPAIAALYALKAVRDSDLPITKRVRIIFGSDEETGVADVEHYLERETPPVSGFTPDANFPAIYAEKGILTFDLAKDLAIGPSGMKIASIQGGTAYNIVPDKAAAEIYTSDPDQIVTACRDFANETGYNLTAEVTNGMVSVRSVGQAAHGSVPYKGKNAVMQLLAFLGTLDLSGSDIGDAIDFLDAKVDMETDGKSFGLAMEDEPSGNLTLNVGMVNATERRIVLALNIRYPVTYSFEDVMGRFNQTIEGTGFKVENMQQNLKPLYYPKDSPLIKTLTEVYAKETGRNDSPIAIGGGTYAKDMPNIVASGPMMPEEEEVEHQPNEYIAIDHLVNITKIYAQDIYELAK